MNRKPCNVYKQSFPLSLCTAEWQVMCEFKALHTDREQGHMAVCLKEFYTFYEVQNLRWAQVRKRQRRRHT